MAGEVEKFLRKKRIKFLRIDNVIAIPKWGYIICTSDGSYIVYRKEKIKLSFRKLLEYIDETLVSFKRPANKKIMICEDSLKRLWKHRIKKILNELISSLNIPRNIIGVKEIIRDTMNLYPKLRKENIYLVDIVVLVLYTYLNRILPMNPIRYLNTIRRQTKFRVKYSKFIRLKAIFNKYRKSDTRKYVEIIITRLPIDPENRKQILCDVLRILDKYPLIFIGQSPIINAAVLVYMIAKKHGIKISAKDLELITGVSRFTILKKYKNFDFA